MKRIYKLMALSMLVLGLAACKKEEAPELTADDIKITTTAVTDITAESAVSGGNITDAGGNTITKRGVCWGEAENPDIKGKFTNDGSGAGAFESEISGLEPGKTYHVRAYAICQAGIAYGNDVSFSVPVYIPTVRTGVTSDLGMDFAVVNGEVLNKMGGTITEVGVLFGTATNPSTKAAAAEVADNFSVELNGLLPDTQYYVKAFATNEAGTGYGEEITFTTSADPVITMTDANLQAALLAQYAGDDGQLHKSGVGAVVELQAAERGITTLEGIKQLTALKVLNVSKNAIAAVDVAGMESLETLDISIQSVGITSVNVDGCTSLKVLNANNPGADGACPESFAPNAPALEFIYLNSWHTIKTLDLSKCVNLKRIDACQMLVLEAVDLTYSNKLEYAYIPDLFAATSVKVASEALDYLGVWNAKLATSMDLSGCPNLRKFEAANCSEVTELKQSFGTALQEIYVNGWQKLKALDLSACVNLVKANLIQLYECDPFVMPTNCSHMTYLWLADALKVKELSITNIPNGARIMMWGNTALETLTYTTNQEIVGWNWNDNMEMHDEGAFPGQNIKHFNITAPNAKKIWFNNAKKLETLDLSASTVLEEFRGCQMNTVTSVTFASPELRFVYMPDAYALTSLDLTCTQKLAQLQMWACNNVKTLKINSPALWEINIVNLTELVTLDANIPNIQFFFVNGCQKLPNFDLTNHTALIRFEGCWTRAMTTIDFTGCTALEFVYFPDSSVSTMTFSNNPKCKTVQGWGCHNLGPDLDLRGCADEMTELNIGTGDAACANLNRVILRAGQKINAIAKRDATEVVYL